MTALLICSIASVVFYPKSCVVVNVDYNTDTVTIEDSVGLLWDFQGCDDWQEEDIVALIMFNNFTTLGIYDDMIVRTRYCGTINGFYSE